MIVEIDGAQVGSERDFHEAMAAQLEFGPYYGYNLAALWDRLSTDVPRPVHLIWRRSAASQLKMGGEEFKAIRTILDRVVEQDANFGLDDRFTYEVR